MRIRWGWAGCGSIGLWSELSLPSLRSEALQPNPPAQYSVTNCSLIGQILLQRKNKAEARAWFLKATVDSGVPQSCKLDETAKGARATAQKKLASC